MFKLITLAILAYLLYRVVVEPKMIDKQTNRSNLNQEPPPPKAKEGDFIDYEEID